MDKTNDNVWKNETWDATRLVREYVKLAARGNFGCSFKKLVWCDQIYYKRIVAVIRAYVGELIPPSATLYECFKSVFGELGGNSLVIFEQSPVDESDKETIMNWLLKWWNQEYERPVPERYFGWRPMDRNLMVSVLLDQRVMAQRLVRAQDSWLECPLPGAMCVHACRSLYDPPIGKANDELDRIIALLLGSSFKKTFTVAELIEKYQYPKETDRELDDWLIDNY